MLFFILLLLYDGEDYEGRARGRNHIYILACLGLIDKELFVYMAMHLHSRSEIAGYYLQFLILRRAKLTGGLNFLLKK